jgi:hypothetical protein
LGNQTNVEQFLEVATLGKVSNIVSHFRRSANAKSRLDNIQRQQGNEPKKLIRDVVTR